MYLFEWFLNHWLITIGSLFAIGIVMFLFIGFIPSFLTKQLIYPRRQPLVKKPGDYGMSYQDIEFKTPDGLTLKGWLIPGILDKMVIITHPMPFTRYGYSVKNQGLFKVSNIEVELLKTAKVLHDQGYTILTFDFRNHGESDKGNEGFTGVGLNEWPDIIGVLDYINDHPGLNNKNIGFVSHCMGANATIIAMSKAKEKFNHVKCLVAVQPVSMNVLVPCMMKNKYPLFLPCVPAINRKCVKYNGFSLADMSPLNYVTDIQVPTLYVQAKSDPWTVNYDVQKFYDHTLAAKELLWLEEKMERFDGYNYFGSHPRKLIEFLKKYL